MQEEWLRQLVESGRVEIRSSARRLLLALVVCLAFTAIGVGLFVLLAEQVPRRQDWPLSLGFWFALVTVGLFGVMGIPSGLLQLAGGRVLVVTTRGVAQLPRPGAAPEIDVAWDEVEALGCWGGRGSRSAVLMVSPDAHQRVLAALPMHGRLMMRANEGVLGPNTFALAANYVGGTEAVLDLLYHARGLYGGGGVLYVPVGEL